MIYNAAKKRVLSYIKESRQQNEDLRDDAIEDMLMRKVQEVHTELIATKYRLPLLPLEKDCGKRRLLT